ncbi:D-sedoheptulose 7-phosphate isomerase [Citrobacter sp. Cu231]|uniref:D-sedoheptulose 7-phosphate isomerase n=1 Tax=Citrobacter sp. Cu231 TaxID=2985159 RepID=UPI002577D99A|nr:D-sedoheptulose 7-phosphate isomerase [Citrobacter sp. Cu231]MDM2743141.1 D-sedoheptulose 7-phosphate isomerase [Citrobacter sp. Cu231]
MSDLILKELNQASEVLEAFIASKDEINKISLAADLIVNAFKNNRKVISCGNGGSHCDAMHFSEELTGRYRNNRKGLAAIAISDPSYMSCVGNDFGFDKVFSRFIESLGNDGDILLAISTSGSALNVKNAIITAHEKGMKVIVLTGGNDNSTMSNMADIEIKVPHLGYADRIQEVHIKIIHIIIHLIENRFL